MPMNKLILKLTRISPNSATGKLLRLPLRLLPVAAHIRVQSGLNQRLKWIIGSGDHGCWLGTYETHIQRAVAELIKEGKIVWDVGANVGFYTLAFSRLVGSSGIVFAFEPYPQNVAYLLEHLKLNSIANVRVLTGALGAADGLISFVVGETRSTGHMGNWGDQTTLMVPSWRADSLLAMNSTVAEPDFVKIDVEGAES